MLLSVRTGWTRTEILALSVSDLVDALSDLTDILKPTAR